MSVLGLDPTEDNETFFDSTDITECLEFYLATDNIDHLWFAINLEKKKKVKAFEKIDFLIDLSQQVKNSYMANQLTTLKNILK
jgi:hypothetical protein